MTWYGGVGWGWCGVLVNVLAAAMFLGAVIAAVVLAVHVRGEGRSDPSALGNSGFARTRHVATSRGARNDTGDDDFYRRLM